MTQKHPGCRDGVVRWPFTRVSTIPVKREFAHAVLTLTRRHDGHLAARKSHAHYLAANGREFKWPVFGAEKVGVSHE